MKIRGEARVAASVVVIVVIASVVVLAFSGARAGERAKAAGDQSLKIAEAFQSRLEEYRAQHHGYPANVEATDLINCVPPYDEVPVNPFSGKPTFLNSTAPGGMVYAYRGPDNYLLLVYGERQTIIGAYAPEQPPLREE